MAAVLLLVVFTLVAVQYANKRLSAFLALVILVVAGFGIAAVQSLILDPESSLAGLAQRAAWALLQGLFVLGVASIIRRLRARTGVPVDGGSSGTSNPFSEDKFSFARVFKAYVVILIVAVVGFAAWMWWLTRGM